MTRKMIPLLLVLLISCKDVKDKATESLTNSVIEKSLERAGVSTENVARANNNNAAVSITYDGNTLFNEINDFKTVINAAGKQMLVFSIDSEDARINISFSGVQDMLSTKPIKGVYKEGNANPNKINGTVASITMAHHNRFAYMLLDGEVTITSFQKDAIVLEFSGRAGNMLAANDPQKWKPLNGKIVCKYPAMSLIQVKSEDLFY